MNNRRFEVGDRVRLREPEQILATLDHQGTLDGVPFMPEMLDGYGKSFRVRNRVEKTCVDGDMVRHFPGDDVLILDGPRCDGSAHDGCKHACRIFWKEAWLQSAGTDTRVAEATTEALAKLKSRLKTQSDAQHYFCQSTELFDATRPFAGSRRGLTARIALREIRNGDLSVFRFARLLVRWIRNEMLDRWLSGPNRKTPSVSLGLQPGDRVRIKSRAEVAKTLNPKGRNRGMGISWETTRCCGRVAEVDRRVDRLIDERTGQMHEIANTVALKNIGGDKRLGEECMCAHQLGDCPRGEHMYWREIWLERL